MIDPILIVGAGPTGLTAALELSRLGVPVRLVDKRDGPATTSRAIGVQARTLELLERRGLAEEMVRLGNKGRYASVYGGGSRIFHMDFAKLESRYEYLLFISQVETERILREAVAAQGVRPEWRTELVALAQNPLTREAAPVTAMLARPDGTIERLKTPWLISAEGAHSLARTTLDLQFEGKTLDEHYALGDCHVEGELADTDLHIFASEHGFLGLFPLGGSHFRMIASNAATGSAYPPSEADLQRIYDQRAHIPARLHDTSWTSWFRINSRMVPRLKVGRLLFGGDSAHIHSPAGAQGMNTGIQDMINLAWKLALVVQGKAPAELLDTYEQDRLPVMRDVLFKTESLTDIIGSHNHWVRGLFNHLGPWIGNAGLVQENATNRMAQLTLGYRDSSLSRDHVHSGTLKAGDRMPAIELRRRHHDVWDDTHLHDLLDPSGFVLFVAHEDPGTMLDRRVIAAAGTASIPIPVVELAPGQGDAAKAYRHALGMASNAFLVRPDGYVAMISGGHAAAADLEGFIRRWLTAGS